MCVGDGVGDVRVESRTSKLDLCAAQYLKNKNELDPTLRYVTG